MSISRSNISQQVTKTPMKKRLKKTTGKKNGVKRTAQSVQRKNRLY